MKKMTLSDIRYLYMKYDCLETASNYLIKRFGKYEPDMIFVISKEMEMDDDGKIIDPLEFTYLYNHTLEGMNVLFNGRVDALVGKFWISKKGNKCFSPCKRSEASHFLIRVDWGGSFDPTRGNKPDRVKEIENVTYFCRKASNGGGTGYDYWVVPKNFKNIIGDDEY